jgi:hypothetical protein
MKALERRYNEIEGIVVVVVVNDEIQYCKRTTTSQR